MSGVNTQALRFLIEHPPSFAPATATSEHTDSPSSLNAIGNKVLCILYYTLVGICIFSVITGFTNIIGTFLSQEEFTTLQKEIECLFLNKTNCSLLNDA
jgi:hypothetical protein